MGKKGKLGKADNMYEDFISIYQDNHVEQRERLSGIKMIYQLRLVLFTQARKQDPDMEPLPQDEAADRRIKTREREIRQSQAQGAESTGRGT
ncbi:MAG: hypothetical protein ACKO96_03715 [Flammeovirgaceae bacterium]